MTAPMVPSPGMRAVVTALTVSSAALSVVHDSIIGPAGASSIESQEACTEADVS